MDPPVQNPVPQQLDSSVSSVEEEVHPDLHLSESDQVQDSLSPSHGRDLAMDVLEIESVNHQGESTKIESVTHQGDNTEIPSTSSHEVTTHGNSPYDVAHTVSSLQDGDVDADRT